MRLAAILPHTFLFGGVRRYIELANGFTRRGHEFIIYTPDGEPPRWCGCGARCERLGELERRRHDVLITGSPEYLELLRAAPAALKVFYMQIEGVDREQEIVRAADLHVMANSTGLIERIRRRYGIEPLDGRGGVNPDIFRPLPRGEEESGTPLRILCYGRLSRPRKGTRFVVQAAEELDRAGHDVELHMFDTRIPGGDDPRIGISPRVPMRFYLDLPQANMAAMYRAADVFVSAEHRAGWSNTCAEAAACALPLVCTASGTRDFAVHGESALVVSTRAARAIRRALERVIGDRGFARRLGEEARRRILQFTWERVCDRMSTDFERLGALRGR